MPKFISVGGGKGGVGKSFFSANISALLSMIGKEVLLVDLDTGGPNVHSFFGISNPDKDISDYFNRSKPLEDCIIKTQYKRLSIISSRNCSQDIGNLPYSSRDLLYKNLQKLKYDYIVLDLGAGINRSLINFFLMADYPIVIFTSNPLSLENAFRFVHKVFLYKIIETVPMRKLRTSCGDLFASKTTVRPMDIVKKLEETNSSYAAPLKQQLEKFNIYLVSNRIKKGNDVGSTIETFYKKFFGENIFYLGYIPNSTNIEKSIYRRELFVAKHKTDVVLKKLMKIAKQLI